MLGPDGIGADGNIIMVDANGRLIAKDGCEARSKDKKTASILGVSNEIQKNRDPKATGPSATLGMCKAENVCNVVNLLTVSMYRHRSS
ncbi:hypothetical protein BDR07DRAFT_1390824 [Suillus spraguei]|nr:hypothetical protein BDR07DRAFT_1390824 [Suillus spraguei]